MYYLFLTLLGCLLLQTQALDSLQYSPNEDAVLGALVARRVTRTKTRKTTATTTTTPLPSGAYVIVSPTACPPAQPTGTLLEQNSALFSKKNKLQYQYYSGSQYTFQATKKQPMFVDLSNPNAVAISINGDSTLILHTDGTFEAFVGGCALQIVGKWQNDGTTTDTASTSSTSLNRRQSNQIFCQGVNQLCGLVFDSLIGQFSITEMCAATASVIGAEIGAGVGFAGSFGNPLIGIPATFVGARVGQLVGTGICIAGLQLLSDKVCDEVVCAQPDYTTETEQCSQNLGVSNSVYCCNGDCYGGLCDYYDLCHDTQGGPPTCSDNQVQRAIPGPGDGTVGAGGLCYLSECSWYRLANAWECCNCPPGYISQTHGQCRDSDSPPIPENLPCVGCLKGLRLVGDGSGGYYCNF